MSTTSITPVLVNGAPVEYDKCPEIARGVLERYIEQGCDPGQGYGRILACDLRAIFACDDETAAQIPAILRWLYNHAPGDCYGDYGRVSSWMRGRRG